MYHVICVETVIPELVQYYFVRREVKSGLWVTLHQPVDGKEQYTFAELIGVHSVAYVTDGADCEQYFDLWIQ